VALVDQNDPTALDAAFERIPSLVLIETPSNPLMRVVDTSEIAKKAKTVGAEVAVDNTFLSTKGGSERPQSVEAATVLGSV
jgi:cystathionine gamma-synthase